MDTEEMTKEKFYELLEKTTFMRKEFGDKLPQLTNDEEDAIYSLFNTTTGEEACEVLKPIYQKYKSKGLPKRVVQAIYFIIMRECIKVWKSDTAIIEDKKNGKENHEKIRILEKDGKLRRNVKMDCTSKTFRGLGDSGSKLQERLGIRPYRDFLMMFYEPVGFESLQFRGELFREIVMNVFKQTEYPMIIDLSGDITILEDVYYNKREIIRCSDSNVSNFYYAVKYKCKELCEKLEELIEYKNNFDEMNTKYKKELTKIKKVTRPELVEALSKDARTSSYNQVFFVENPRFLRPVYLSE